MKPNLKLKALRVGNGMKQKDLSALLGLKSEAPYCQKENGKRQFSQREISIIVDRFNLSGNDIKDIFFTS